MLTKGIYFNSMDRHPENLVTPVMFFYVNPGQFKPYSHSQFVYFLPLQTSCQQRIGPYWQCSTQTWTFCLGKTPRWTLSSSAAWSPKDVTKHKCNCLVSVSAFSLFHCIWLKYRKLQKHARKQLWRTQGYIQNYRRWLSRPWTGLWHLYQTRSSSPPGMWAPSLWPHLPSHTHLWSGHAQTKVKK